MFNLEASGPQVEATERELAAFHEILGEENSSLSSCNEVLGFLLMGLNGSRTSGDRSVASIAVGV